MAYSLACRDAGIDCSFVAEGETTGKALAEGVAHVKEVHEYTDEQLRDPEVAVRLRSTVKKKQTTPSAFSFGFCFPLTS